MSQKLILVVFLLCCCTTIMAQREKVYLSNGGVIRGSLIQVSSDKVSIFIDSLTTIHINTESVKAIKTKKRKTRLSALELFMVDSINMRSINHSNFSQLYIGLIVGREEAYSFTQADFSIDYAFHVKTNHKTSIGFGVGLEYYPSFEVIPFFLEYRKNFRLIRSGFFYYARTGYSLAKARPHFSGSSTPSVKGRGAFGLGLGYQWPIGKNKMMITVGGKRQKLYTIWRDGNFESYTNWTLRRLEFKIGMTF